MLVNASALNDNQIKGNSIFFLFGTDEGLILRSKIRITKAYDASNSNTYTHSFASAKENVAEIVADSKSGSLFGERKVVIIDQIAGNISEKFFDNFTKCNTAIYIFAAGSVKKTSKLFKYFQKRQEVVTVQCYQLELREIAQFIVQYFRLKSKKIDYNDAEALAAILPKNIMIVERELEKLDLFTGKNQTITSQNFIDLLIDNADFSTDNIVYKLFTDKNNAVLEIEGMISQTLDARQDSIMIIRSTLNMIRRLMMVHIQKRSGAGTEAAINSLKPPIFFKFRNKFEHLVSITNIKMLREMMLQLNELEKFAKFSAHDCTSMVANHFLGAANRLS